MAKSKVHYTASQTKARKRLSKRLVYSLLAVVCSFALLAVGVYATSTNYTVAIENNIKVKIAIVQGSLSARRTGGVYGENTIASFKKGEEAADFSGTIYTTEAGEHTTSVDGANMKVNAVLEGTTLNVDNLHPQICYYFTFTRDADAESETRALLTYSDVPQGLTATYEYYLGARGESVSFDSENKTPGIQTLASAQSVTTTSDKPIIYFKMTLTLDEDLVQTNKISKISGDWAFTLEFMVA